MAYGDLKIRNLIWNTGSGDNAVALSTLLTTGANTYTGNQSLGDNIKVLFGTGNDLQIYHNGSNSFIEQTGTGNLVIKDNTGSGGVRIFSNDFQIKNQADSEDIAKFIENGAVNLYYDGVKKFETTSGGAKVTGELQVTGDVHLNNGTNSGKDVKFVAASNLFRIYDDVKLTCGTSDDLKIYHNGSHSYIVQNGTGNLYIDAEGTNEDLYLRANRSVYIQASGSTEHGIKVLGDSGVELYYDNSKKLETTGAGVTVQSQLKVEGSETSQLNGNQLRFERNSTSYIDQIGGGSLAFRTMHSGSETTRMTVQSGGNVNLPDNGHLTFGASNDLQIYHDGSNSFINNTTGEIRTNDTWRWDDNAKATFGYSNDLQIYHDGTQNLIEGTVPLYIKGSHVVIYKGGTTEKMLQCTGDGATSLWYDNAKKLETTSGGVNVTGALTVNGAAVGGGTWDILGTTDFSSSNANYSENTGWNASDYIMVKCIFSWVSANPDGSDMSMRFYLATSYGGNGTLNTSNEYRYSSRWRTWGYANESATSNQGTNVGTRWRFGNNGGSDYWSGEVTIPLVPFAPTNSLGNKKKFAVADIWRTANQGSENFEMLDSEPDLIVGARLYNDGGDDFTYGRVTWYGLKYA